MTDLEQRAPQGKAAQGRDSQGGPIQILLELEEEHDGDPLATIFTLLYIFYIFGAKMPGKRANTRVKKKKQKKENSLEGFRGSRSSYYIP